MEVVSGKKEGLFGTQKERGIAIGDHTKPFSVDEDQWPHYKVIEELPPLKTGEQTVLIKEAIVNYFREKELI